MRFQLATVALIGAAAAIPAPQLPAAPSSEGVSDAGAIIQGVADGLKGVPFAGPIVQGVADGLKNAGSNRVVKREPATAADPDLTEAGAVVQGVADGLKSVPFAGPIVQGVADGLKSAGSSRVKRENVPRADPDLAEAGAIVQGVAEGLKNVPFAGPIIQGVADGLKSAGGSRVVKRENVPRADPDVAEAASIVQGVADGLKNVPFAGPIVQGVADGLKAGSNAKREAQFPGLPGRPTPPAPANDPSGGLTRAGSIVSAVGAGLKGIPFAGPIVSGVGVGLTQAGKGGA
ncbi:hypothetical protein K402DRAFT_400581 [Aulographum hederae CBS 113979]|uniref:Uncharacterized protein n=1 Tax=Aulographum hederae CBS 113979 TaxID=1176131 RepID=A0A6G1HDI1_9PEZI|nr:hypothetical protein K402DRAFT_400581 [Aulographum hederae CBS 113979]